MDTGNYFLYLFKKVDGFGAYPDRLLLLRQLFQTEFKWDARIELDADRAEDGKGLRLLYFHETHKDSHMFGPCNVFEMLLAMAIDMENIMGEPGDDHPEHWFWEMLDNIHVANVMDYNYDAQFVDEMVTNWMERKYDRKEVGGVFPLTKSRRDVRRMPIWEQAGMYMTERC